MLIIKNELMVGIELPDNESIRTIVEKEIIGGWHH